MKKPGDLIRYIGTNDRGLRVGQFHHKAKLTDAEVDQVRDLHEFAGWGYLKIARTYGVSKSNVAQICRYEKRTEMVTSWKPVKVLVAAPES